MFTAVKNGNNTLVHHKQTKGKRQTGKNMFIVYNMYT